MLSQVELYSAKIIDTIEPSKFKCKCRFGHIFTYETLEDWCKICQTLEFNKSLISEINTELDEMDMHLVVKKISKYGIATLKCKNNHIIKCDMDYIPNNCVECVEKVYNLSQTDENYSSDSCCHTDWADIIDDLSDSETIDGLSKSESHAISHKLQTSDDYYYTKKIRTTEYREDNIDYTTIQFNEL